MSAPRPVPFRDALNDLRRRQVLPTSLTAREIDGLDQVIRDNAFFSARVTEAEILNGMMEGIDRILGGGPRGPGQIMDPALFRVQMREMLDSISYAPEDPRDVGTIKDLRTDARLNLIVRTQEEMATGRGQYIASTDPDTIDLWPAWELIRLRDSKVKRNWPQRWAEAAATAGDAGAARMLSEHGRMLARKDSGIWTALSRFGRPHPPFDYNSGMDVEDVERDECIALGLIRTGDRIQAPQKSQGPDLAANVSSINPELRSALASGLGPDYRIDDEGVLHRAA